tara:strand:+ start:1616 stop:2206 length:591 start_codon:yes stop_codon:yes gene_type:complete
MGDRTWVDIFVLSTDRKRAVACAGGEMECGEELTLEDPGTGCQLVCFQYYDVNYGNLGFEDALIEGKVPFDKAWGPGGEYAGGSAYHRVNASGKSDFKDFYEGEIGVISLDLIQKAAANGLDAVKNAIADADRAQRVMPWDNQKALFNYRLRYISKPNRIPIVRQLHRSPRPERSSRLPLIPVRFKERPSKHHFAA